MSFSGDVKEELLRAERDRPCCLRAELSALTQSCASLGFRGGGRFFVTYQLSSAALARRLFTMLKDGLGLVPQLHFVQHARLGGRRSSVLTVEGDDAPKLLSALGMMETEADGKQVLRRTSPHPQLHRQCCRRAYLRGAFLGVGAMTSPEKGYHLEWACPEEEMALTVERQLERSEISARHHLRRERVVVYLKSSTAIGAALTAMGAVKARMAFENQTIQRQMHGDINRAANCDEHNDNRLMDASASQIRAITLISVERGLFTLPPALRELARLRLENPELALPQLGQLTQPPISKSGVNSRMRRLMALAEELQREALQKGAGT